MSIFADTCTRMLNNIEKIQTENREIILIGTAHVSKESVGLSEIPDENQRAFSPLRNFDND